MIKPTVLVVFIIGIAGYNFLRNIHKTHYMLKRSSGYHTFFSSSSAGILLFIISSFLYYWLVSLGYNYSSSSSLGKLILDTTFSTNFSPKSVAMAEISVITLLLSQLLPAIYYFPIDRKKLMRREFLQDAESPEFTRLFYRSSLTGIPILFTMSDRKVYIGYIYEMQEKQYSDIYILPFFSGYRCDKELKLKKVTPYKPIIDALEDKERSRIEALLSTTEYTENEKKEYIDEYLDKRKVWADFIVALPLREIVHAHLHDFAHEEMFQEQEFRHRWKTLGSWSYDMKSTSLEWPEKGD